MNMLLLMQQVAAEDLPFLPTTVSGYMSLTLSLISVVTIGVAYGKWLEKLNGMGGRVKLLEEAKAGAEAERDLFRTSIDRLLTQHESLIGQLGRHERSTESCREDTEKLGIDLGVKLSDLTREVGRLNLDLSTRITRVETTLVERIRPVHAPERT